MKRFKIILIIILSGLIIFSLQNASKENGQIKKLINDFIKDSTFEYEDNNTKYYKVSRETSSKPAIKDGFLGQPGDIILTKSSPIYLFGFKQTVDFYFGGHVSIVTSSKKLDNLEYGDIGDMCIESVGNQGDDNGVRIVKNDWLSNDYRKDIIGLRIKNYDKNDYYNALDKAHSLIGKKYNYLFFLNTKNRYYCTDLISRLYNLKNVKLNDGFITSTNDIILSDNVYIFFYQYIDSENVKHIYY